MLVTILCSADSVAIVPGIGCRNNKGLGYLKTTLFIVAQLTGVGFLALPKAMSYTGDD